MVVSQRVPQRIQRLGLFSFVSIDREKSIKDREKERAKRKRKCRGQALQELRLLEVSHSSYTCQSSIPLVLDDAVSPQARWSSMSYSCCMLPASRPLARPWRCWPLVIPGHTPLQVRGQSSSELAGAASAAFAEAAATDAGCLSASSPEAENT